ncbi:MAG: hypothetical protein A3A44_03420 [Candidatus Sungbacteria bacterium RIFCSPLOWO2_01_FULL_60_25]|uniref:Uncharacterized protein n=1 Tax=Candidatus Sungbacteria bacterium RIFCSPLOWO2_01_FULL_60_25 TaxID=1802281 RepID=A0A1G2LCG4_9BACT|nr:MAG: hypothetical protein A3A44_03420 [Candidatus Sungbacteria bacterium RIFCSPLOWO2_01_FULL_60_25]
MAPTSTYGSIGREGYKSYKSLFDLAYFESRDEIQQILTSLGVNQSHPLTLPEYPAVMQVSKDLGLSPRVVLLAYQRLKASDQSDVICGWNDSSGLKCGGMMDEEVTALGVYYQCRLDAAHRTKK